VSYAKIYFASSRPRAASTVSREWQVVLVPDNNALDMIGL